MSSSVSPSPSAETVEPVVAAGGSTASPSEEVVGNKRAAPETENPDASSYRPNKKTLRWNMKPKIGRTDNCSALGVLRFEMQSTIGLLNV
ncbi:hypothetical protein Esi_0172_0038 [Ectocarpus siliculosus]|uniref:Uncharacterized protein n=1 Tax=Ectocarpus siliculosus TaxID=2880 RepID=D7FMZ1_ECTSI|nr:hypothetical protein Esi_0172_0038 [Ectocarpus siliculosus]|eukprot:CBJ30055.1 hypothetical protein Esi_0172_0038 [Ectocarpus siliculosus]